ncbi:hypothetical protein CFK41_08540 [Brachybacterium ginsengisoli]|uniref:Integral membrane protein n=1 Tax=Brachybacterium ginsengisoli TaxID=1331682 RepID=A0A291GXA8_9MICO|nr:hypothetical protein [Brachybacterium ginsengisoli]ATG54808.1 hypothetical protein CFK41_08540 [Brachybacterium ginsengisoli]
MSVLSIVVAVLCGVTALLGLYYALRELNADLVLLGASALLAVAWFVLGSALALRDLAGGDPPDRITLYGYLLTALVLVVGGGWMGLFERSRWGSLVAGLGALVSAVLLMRLHQIWPGGFA